MKRIYFWPKFSIDPLASYKKDMQQVFQLRVYDKQISISHEDCAHKVFHSFLGYWGRDLRFKPFLLVEVHQTVAISMVQHAGAAPFS